MTDKKSKKWERRIAKARVWVTTYEGTHIVRSYRKAFHVDMYCALRDLYELGAITELHFTQGVKEEQRRIKTLKEKKELQKQQAFMDLFPFSDDTFYFIAGYTSGGFAYGTTWEEMGLQPYELLDE